jgi:hypothetical protein
MFFQTLFATSILLPELPYLQFLSLTIGLRLSVCIQSPQIFLYW